MSDANLDLATLADRLQEPVFKKSWAEGIADLIAMADLTAMAAEVQAISKVGKLKLEIADLAEKLAVAKQELVVARHSVTALSNLNNEVINLLGAADRSATLWCAAWAVMTILFFTHIALRWWL